MFAASLTHAAWSNYEEVRELNLDAGDLQALAVESGAGGLRISGVAGADRILVTATIEIPDASDDKAKKIIESGLVLTLEREGDQAVLKSRFDSSRRLFADSPRIHLEVQVPERLALNVDDGSGPVTVEDVRGDIDVKDGSGSLQLSDAGGRVRIDDGSGSIAVSGAHGDLSIVDGSGSITVRDGGGSVTIDDGSGSIDVTGVAGDLIIEDDGSGTLNFNRIEGAVVNR
jgi:DUF4097 and DUF4098 domain-containing protein YvlB